MTEPEIVYSEQDGCWQFWDDERCRMARSSRTETEWYARGWADATTSREGRLYDIGFGFVCGCLLVLNLLAGWYMWPW